MTGHTSGVLGSDPAESADPHPPTISKRPENKKRSPAVTDMPRAQWPDPRGPPIVFSYAGGPVTPSPVVLQGSGLRGPGSTSRLAKRRMVV
jgi:hypothetical protein